MRISQRLQEANRRRYQGEAGFTLIELLVVILIVAILAAVGIIALLAAINSGKKSAATTNLNQAVTAVKSLQTAKGQTNFANIEIGTPGGDGLAGAEPGIKFQTGLALNTTETGNHVGFSRTNNTEIQMSSRSDSKCYFVKITSDAGTEYATQENVDSSDCSAPTTGWADSQKDGWK